LSTTQPAPAEVQPEASSFQAQRDTQQWPKNNPQTFGGGHVVDAEFAAVLEQRFGIPMAFILRALKGEPWQQAVALCRLATRHQERNGTLLMLARRFGRGRTRRRRTAGTLPRGRGRVSPRPSVDRIGTRLGADFAAPRVVASAHRGGSLPGIPDPEMLDDPAARMGP